MSGIINSAGSRSGVIGTTELDYEEGTWTPPTGTVNSIDFVMSSHEGCVYTKIGNTVFLSGEVTFGANTADYEPVYIGGLPFVPTATTGNFCGKAHTFNYTHTPSVVIQDGQNYISLKKSFDAEDFVRRTDSRYQAYIFSIAYKTAS